MLVAVGGTALWTVTGLLLALFGYHWLSDHDRLWWLWTCFFGAIGGGLGIGYCALKPERIRTAVKSLHK